MTDLLGKLAMNYASVMEKILQAFSDIADVLPRLDRLKATFPEDTNFNQVIGLIYSDIIEFHRRAYKLFRRKAWHFWFAFDWGLFERRFKLILQKLDIHCDLLDKEAAAAHFSEMKKFREKRQLEEDAFERQRQNQMAKDVFIWLSAAEEQQEEQLHRISDNRQPGTCDWILKDPQVRPWIEDDGGDAVLWVTGIPGAGKSYLCSLLVQNLQSQQHLSTLYFFCDHQSSSETTCAVMLRTLAIQLLQQNLDMTSLVHQAYLQKGSTRSSPAMKNLLIKIIHTSKAARVVVDGIDENEHTTQQEILKSLIDIQKSADHHCKLLVCSRDEPQIQKSLAARLHLKLGEKTVEGLSLYIEDRIKDLQASFPGMDAALVSRAEQRLHSKANGMFLWVRLVTDMLIFQTSELEFENAIDKLPEGLDKAYKLILSRIESLRPVQLRQRAFSILYWVCAARRPVLLHEVADGIVLHSAQTALNRRTRSNNPSRDIIELCAPLLERLKNGVLDLVHFSAKEYFIHEQSGPFIDLAVAHFNIGLSCMINLTSCLDLVPRTSGRYSEGDLESRVVQGYYGLQSYGQEFWAEHVLAYLGKMGNRDLVSQELIGAMEAFSQVWKHHTHAGIPLPSTIHTAEASLGLQTLRSFPMLHRFTSGWLHFKSESNKTMPTLNTLDAQQNWRLGKDETFLSLIDSRLCDITERLLMMQSSQLPPHIDEIDFKHFVSRFKITCRFQDCSYQCDTVQDRDSHEVSHVLSFPCLQCDFSGRGFRSRKLLEKHTRKYHMSAEDFEIPDDLRTMGEYFGGGSNVTSGAFRGSSSRSGRWTEQGRKALQQGFHKVLTRLESEIAAATGDDGEYGSKVLIPAESAEPTISQQTDKVVKITSLDSIRDSIREQKYGSLTDFKNDINILSGDPTVVSILVGDGRIESICEDELEKAMSAFPAFANLDHTALMRGKMVASLSKRTEEPQGYAKDLNEQLDEISSPNTVSSGIRVPYWSLPEKKQLPELLQRYGRDFAKVADHLKTKTPKEVEQHLLRLLSMGETELSDLADLADAKVQQEACSAGATIDPREPELEIPRDDLAYGDSKYLLQSSQVFTSGSYISSFGHPKPPLPPIQGTSNKAETNMDSGQNVDAPPRKKRRPRPKVPCPYCSVHKDGLRDEYTLEKHKERYHMATRKVWICQDISIDKRFFTKCKSCSASKRYSSKTNAKKHLRQVHFTAETSTETLHRWMREVEEPNPNMQAPSKDSTSTTPLTMKRPKTMGKNISLPPLKGYLDSSRTLPSMLFEKPINSVGLDDNMDDDEDTDASVSSSESESLDNNFFSEDISFDNFLPGNASEQRLTSTEGPPHRIKRGLIRPDQVSRLPSLNSFQQTACLDQVEALYHKLDSAAEESSDYKEALENLTSLSKKLMRDLRDWQQQLARAPHIPFSL